MVGDENLVRRDYTWRIFCERKNQQIFSYWGTPFHPPLWKTLLKIINNPYKFLKTLLTADIRLTGRQFLITETYPKLSKTLGKDKGNFKTLWPLIMDGVELPQGYNHFEEAFYFGAPQWFFN